MTAAPGSGTAPRPDDPLARLALLDPVREGTGTDVLGREDRAALVDGVVAVGTVVALRRRRRAREVAGLLVAASVAVLLTAGTVVVDRTPGGLTGLRAAAGVLLDPSPRGPGRRARRLRRLGRGDGRLPAAAARRGRRARPGGLPRRAVPARARRRRHPCLRGHRLHRPGGRGPETGSPDGRRDRAAVRRAGGRGGLPARPRPRGRGRPAGRGVRRVVAGRPPARPAVDPVRVGPPARPAARPGGVRRPDGRGAPRVGGRGAARSCRTCAGTRRDARRRLRSPSSPRTRSTRPGPPASPSWGSPRRPTGTACAPRTATRPWTTCAWTGYPVLPDPGSLSAQAGIEAIYVHRVEVVAPCLRAQGVDVAPAPSLEEFFLEMDQLRSWTPWSSLTAEDMPDAAARDRLRDACPGDFPEELQGP